LGDEGEKGIDAIKGKNKGGKGIQMDFGRVADRDPLRRGGRMKFRPDMHKESWNPMSSLVIKSIHEKGGERRQEGKVAYSRKKNP